MKNENIGLWNELAEIHRESDFYDLCKIVDGTSSLLSVEVELMRRFPFGRVLHTHCHIGTDTISLSRSCEWVTGVDFSKNAIAIAREAATKAKRLNCKFVCADSQSLKSGELDQLYDTVFASYGVLAWVSNIDKWFDAHRAHLKAGGRLIIIDEHPVAATFDRSLSHDSLYPYIDFSGGGIPYQTRNPKSYTGDAKILENQVQTKWQHSLSDIMNGAILSGLNLVELNEYSKCHYPILDGMKQAEDGYFYHDGFGKRVPLMFSAIFEAS